MIVKVNMFIQKIENVQNLWKIRENIPESLLRYGYVYKYDITLPHELFYEIVPEIRKRLDNLDVKAVCGYGHLGNNHVFTVLLILYFDLI